MSNAVKAWRQRLELTQAEAARGLGVTLRNFQAYEAGAYDPPETVRKLMTAMANGIELSPWPLDAKKGKRK